jgi:hypothetical protein
MVGRIKAVADRMKTIAHGLRLAWWTVNPSARGLRLAVRTVADDERWLLCDRASCVCDRGSQKSAPRSFRSVSAARERELGTIVAVR